MAIDPSLTPEMSIDPEGVVDLERTSALALIAVLAAALGTLAVIEPTLAPLPLIAAILGFIVFLRGKSWQISKLSVSLASVAMVLGAFSFGSAMSQRYYRNNYVTAKAISVAEGYIDALARGDRNLAIKLVGLPQEITDEDRDIPLSREQQAVRDFLNDKLVQEVISKGEKAKWQPTGVLSMEHTEGTVESKVGFIDANMTNQIPMVVTVRMSPPGKYSAETKTRWLVTALSREGSS